MKYLELCFIKQLVGEDASFEIEQEYLKAFIFTIK